MSKRRESSIKLHISDDAIHHCLVRQFYRGVCLVSVCVLHLFITDPCAVLKIVKAVVVGLLLISVV